MSTEMEKAYEPSKYESDIYKRWEKSGAFVPNDSNKEPFSIILPPPNANGNLHTGHAMYVVEDIMARYHRMQGRPTLWLPGMDHAGIETQVVFERELEKVGKSRFDLGRDEFYRQVWEYTQANKKNMADQLRSLGFSLDWSREKFTLDADIVEIVYATFRKLHDDGLIYRGNRIVNWCPRCRSGFADIEVKHEDQEGTMYTVDYGTVQIATTRPETIFADSAVAVNPQDKRYAKLVGKTATIPLINRPVQIIADEHVDPDTGTGALKVTPAHDPNDYEIGLRHELTQIAVVDLDGKLINVPEELLGLTTSQARVKTVELLEAAGKLVGRTSLSHSVGTHGRCGTVIEPLITEQWWLKVQPLTEPAIEAVKNGSIKIVPKRFEKMYINWLDNLHDWNISRQDWWGIRIPVYYKTSNDPSKEAYIIATDEAAATKYYGAGNYRAETDIFDTWFSSSQWPFATLKATGDFERFYPTSVMETGRDILFLWVTRMVMLGLYSTGDVPFKTVYLHGMVNDAQGKKMSKSKGNVINPLDITAKYGTDALRLALTIGITPGNDGSLSEEKVQGYRNFCNKLWNVARYILSQVPADYSPAKPAASTVIDEWILSRIAQETTIMTRSLDSYSFSDAGQSIYGLLWNDFADWYIEASKVSPNLDLLVYGLETILKLAHPIAPFVTEAIWQKMAWHKQDLIVTEWPTGDANTYSSALVRFESVKAIVEQARAAISEMKLWGPVLSTNSELLLENADLLKRLARVREVTKAEQGSGLLLATPGHDAWLEVSADELRNYQTALQAKHDEQSGYISKLQNQLDNSDYVKSAPAHVVQDTRDRLEQAQVLLSKLNEQIKRLDS